MHNLFPFSMNLGMDNSCDCPFFFPAKQSSVGIAYLAVRKEAVIPCYWVGA